MAPSRYGRSPIAGRHRQAAKPWASFRRHPVLLVEAATAVITARAVVEWLPASWLLRLAKLRRRRLRSLGLGRAAWAVNAVSRRLPGRDSCLTRALAFQLLAGWAGHRTTLHLGARRRGEALGAHAWVEADGVVWMAQRQDLAGYAPLVERGE